MKKHKITFIMILFFFIGLLVLLYPSISNYHNQKVQSKAIFDYESLLNNYNNNDYDNLFALANNYNLDLNKLTNPFVTHNTIKNYHDVLNINGSGMMGYLTINKIKVELPIYHGTSEDVLSKAVGHVEGSSLPVGGKGTHSVLSAHRGLPSSKLFTELDKLEIGDTFTITILNRTLTYEVDKITIVNPNDTKELTINPDEDYVTLLTCTPYGINTHRLLVRGKRINDIPKTIYVTTEAFRINTLIVMPMVAIPIILVLLLIILIKPVKNNKVRKKYLNKIETKTKEIKKGESYEKES